MLKHLGCDFVSGRRKLIDEAVITIKTMTWRAGLGVDRHLWLAGLGVVNGV